MIDFTRLQVIVDTQVSTYKLSYQEAIRLVFTAYNVVINHPEVIVTDNYNHDFSEQEIEELRNFVVDHPDSFAEQLIMEIHAGCTLADCECIGNISNISAARKLPENYTYMMAMRVMQDTLKNMADDYHDKLNADTDKWLYTE
jgi:hypothetical protein